VTQEQAQRIPRLVPLTDGTITLRPWSDADAAFIARACQDPDIPRWTTVPYAMDDAQALDWVRRFRDLPGLDLAAPFAIVLAPTGESLGSVGLGNFDWREAIGHVYYWLAAEHRGRGYATRAVRLVTAWAIRELGLARIELYAHPDNAASHRVAERSGFTREGLLRSAMVVKGVRWDVVLFSLLPGDGPG
jgi:[ribosomal protein S5]-alanine N-acetyltransferase